MYYTKHETFVFVRGHASQRGRGLTKEARFREGARPHKGAQAPRGEHGLTPWPYVTHSSLPAAATLTARGADTDVRDQQAADAHSRWLSPIPSRSLTAVSYPEQID
jgi:hypothetical protein